MSLISMTGYGQGNAQGENYQLLVEIKSVNHRFRDIRFKMSHLFFSFENQVKKDIENLFGRGSFDIYVSYKELETQSNEIHINKDKAANFLRTSMEIASECGAQVNLSPSLFLKTEFAQAENKKEVELKSLFMPAVNSALLQLKEQRQSEGDEITKLFHLYITDYNQHLMSIKKQRDGFRPHLESKLKKRMSESDINIEGIQDRLLQEIIFYLEKWDIDEEITRIENHMKSLFETTGMSLAGRKIDFTLQELSRETNTIGSKSHNNEISQTVIEMKLLLEKMREQAANVE